ncbi:MAG: tetratricopeptide repeat protein [Candidatus Buchananbacteria bacterium]|nr:tetratricopeptide repeat protein [Candidatus Buchananbacteria bacterium]
MKKLSENMKNQQNLVYLIGGVVIILILGVLIFVYYQPSQPTAPDYETVEGMQYMKLTAEDLPDDKFALYEQAIDTLKEEPFDRTSLLNLGYIYRDLGAYEQAITAFSQHLNVDPYDPEIILGLARVRTDQGQFKEAEKHYYEILEVFPLYTLAYKELLTLYQDKLLEPNQAFIEQINRSLEFDQENKNQYQQRLNEYLSQYNQIPKD